MRILFTGGSSFTGLWFARALQAAGHEVTATLTQDGAEAYGGARGERVTWLGGVATLVGDCRFGDDRFLELLGDPWDVVCHHGARVGDYRSPDFPVIEATAANTHRLAEVLATGNVGAMVVTGSVFEFDEGDGAGGDRVAFSPYGVSKGLSYQIFRDACRRAEVALGKFVISNPFGPYEEMRFTSFMARSWIAGENPAVRTPDYVRDNIHVDLLARAYVEFVERVGGSGAPLSLRANPSGYVETQGAFAQRFAVAMRERGLPAPEGVACLENAPHDEPMTRVNTEPAARRFPDWDESAAWDALAGYYRNVFAGGNA